MTVANPTVRPQCPTLWPRMTNEENHESRREVGHDASGFLGKPVLNDCSEEVEMWSWQCSSGAVKCTTVIVRHDMF